MTVVIAYITVCVANLIEGTNIHTPRLLGYYTQLVGKLAGKKPRWIVISLAVVHT